MYTAQLNTDDYLTHLIARLGTKGHSHIYSADYHNIFSPVIKMSFVQILISLAAINPQPLHQLDIKNGFLHGILNKVYIEQPPGFVAQRGHWLGQFYLY